MRKEKQKRLVPLDRKDKVSRCALCRGTKLLCGKDRCPVMMKFQTQERMRPRIDRIHMGGASPPSVFVGRVGYPKVAVGPMIPPEMGDTSLIDTPERWLGCTLDDIVGFRSQLVRGKTYVDVGDVEAVKVDAKAAKAVEYTRELALSKNPVFAEAVFEKRPRGNVQFFSDAQPHGPSAAIKTLDITNPQYERHMEKAYYDTDLGSRDAIVDIYRAGVPLSKLQRAFSIGAFGRKKTRKFVPTRWSITAVDSTLGLELLKKTKEAPLINEYRIHRFDAFDNRWLVVFLPTEWRYELIEAWYPKTTWNQYGSTISIYNSYEFYEGRKRYAEIGGCYYAARLAVNELLTDERRQAGCVVLREAHPGYVLPVGVWNVRECVRAALREAPRRVDTFSEVMEMVGEVMDIPVERWLRNSAVLSDRMCQRRLEEFC